MPSSYRAELKDGLVATQSMDGAITVLPVATFREKARELTEAPRTREQRRLQRGMFTNAEELKLDSQGRILLSSDLRKYAGIDGLSEVRIAGMLEYIEIWHPDRFEEEDQQVNRQYRDDEEAPGF